MNVQSGPHQVWTLTARALDKLLDALHPDRERAGELYELARRKLAKFFEWRGCPEPETYADEVMNRVARRLDTGEQIENINSYFAGVARHLLLENFKEQERRQQAYAQIERAAPAVYDQHVTLEDDDQIRLRCFESCLAGLPVVDRELITKYYTDEGRAKIENRRNIAEQLNVPLNALRIRAHRIRQRLEACVAACVNGVAM